jgi:hypothetical protein
MKLYSNHCTNCNCIISSDNHQKPIPTKFRSSKSRAANHSNLESAHMISGHFGELACSRNYRTICVTTRRKVVNEKPANINLCSEQEKKVLSAKREGENLNKLNVTLLDRHT